MQATLEKIEQLADGIVTFWFKPEGRFRYVAGEFTEMYIPHVADERGEKRWFTLSSSPTEPLLGITTSFSEGFSSSFKQALQGLQPGDNVRLAEPMGDFVLPKSTDIPLTFIAGGLGITPIRSIVRSLADTGQKRSIRLLRIAGPKKAHLFEGIFANYPMRLDYINSNDPSRDEMIDEHVATVVGSATPNTMFYLAGPEKLIQRLADMLAKNGIDARQIVTDFFPGYTTF